MKERLLYLVKLYITLIFIFVIQKILFLIFNYGLSDGATFGMLIGVLVHGIPLDSVAASYIMIIPTLVVLVSCFFRSFPARKVLRPYYWIAAFLMATIFLADMIVYRFWGAKIDANDLIYAQKPQELLASLKWWSMLLALIALALFTFHYYRRLRWTTAPVWNRLKHLWHSVAMVAIIALVFVGMRGSFSESTANPSFAFKTSNGFCNHAALNPFFNMVYSLFKTQDLDNEFRFLSDEEAAAMVGNAYESDFTLADTLLSCQRPNILLILWESASYDVVMDEAVAPNMVSYAREGVLFDSCYANSFRTDRGIVSVLSGWPGLPTSTLMRRSELCQRLPSLAHELHNVGYRSRYVYGGDINFTNKRLYLVETGFDEIQGDQYFEQGKNDSKWGAPDQYLLIPERVATQYPSFTVLQTLSSHEPWIVPMHRLQDERRNAFAYTDSCIGSLLQSLRSTSLWDSLLVIIVADHGVAHDGLTSRDYEVSHIPIVWTGGAVARPTTISHLMNQNDLAATLMAQLGIDPMNFIFSRNVCGIHYPHRNHFAVHTYKNGLNFIDSTGVVTYDCIDYAISDETKRPFIEAYLQNLYHRTATLGH